MDSAFSSDSISAENLGESFAVRLRNIERNLPKFASVESTNNSTFLFYFLTLAFNLIAR
jgi:hypothetical protein